MSGHTPGPWVAERHDFYDDGWIISDAEIYRVAMVPNFSGKPENEANACLIAAAPDLLEVVRKCRDYLSCIPESAAGGDDEAVALARAATAAIAKATKP